MNPFRIHASGHPAGTSYEIFFHLDTFPQGGKCPAARISQSSLGLAQQANAAMMQVVVLWDKCKAAQAAGVANVGSKSIFLQEEQPQFRNPLCLVGSDEKAFLVQ